MYYFKPHFKKDVHSCFLLGKKEVENDNSLLLFHFSFVTTL